MGIEGKQYALVVMTNKDVYYIDKEIASLLLAKMHRRDIEGAIEFVDTKSRARVTISMINVSSLVINEVDRG